jgi:hypothetical protein
MMSEIGTFNTANSLPGDLVKTLMEGVTAQTEQALKVASVQMEAQVKLQEQATAMGVVAMMTGVGTRLDTVA